MPNMKTRRRTAALAACTAGVLLALPALPASADLTSPSYLGVEIVTPSANVDPTPVNEIVDGAVEVVERNVNLNVDPSRISAPVGVDPSQDPTTIQVWDFIEPPVSVKPEETALSTSDREMMAAEGEDGGGCEGWYYDVDSNYGLRHTVRTQGTDYSYDNTSDSEGTITVENKETMSASVTVSANIEADEGVILASVKTKFGVEITASYSWETVVGRTQKAAPHAWTHLRGGISGYTTQGHYYHMDPNCVIDVDHGTLTAFTPEPQTDVYKSWQEPAA